MWLDGIEPSTSGLKVQNHHHFAPLDASRIKVVRVSRGGAVLRQELCHGDHRTSKSDGLTGAPNCAGTQWRVFQFHRL
jgi:hypothetical protein